MRSLATRRDDLGTARDNGRASPRWPSHEKRLRPPRLQGGRPIRSAIVTRSLGRVAELADAQDSGSCVRKDVGVQVPPRPPPPPEHHQPDRPTGPTTDLAPRA